ncbi:MAG: ABC transporter permease [Phycisphaerales bacterium]|nr:ABC transporter permease [Phycisphaerales bacterium]
MHKTLMVAWREFTATVLTKGFLLGVIMTPVMLVIVFGAMSMMRGLKGPQIAGEVALIDRTGAVAAGVEERFTAAADARDAEDRAAKARAMIDKAGPLAAQGGGMAAAEIERQARERSASTHLTLRVLPADANVDVEREPLARAQIKTQGQAADAGGQAVSRLALIVVPEGSVAAPAAGAGYAPFSAYFAEKLDFEVQDRITGRVREAIVEARLAGDPRLVGAGLTPSDLLAMVRQPKVESKTIDRGGHEKDSVGEFRMLIPMGFMLLLMTAVFTGGQGLLTSTVEEKSSRVMEVLLSAVSPMQIMVGKILGQMGVGLVILVIYSGLGVTALVVFLHRANLISAMDLVYLFIFFILAYFIVASMMAAIGSAVNDMREAQTLMAPVMMVIMLPWLSWFLIQRAPNSTLATILSFVPGINPFIMVIRLSGSEPIPSWQIPVGIAVGVATVVVSAWAAAKVFRIGALMHGRPPNFATLIRWIRMA